ncbi:MAG: zf-HC2 domain-containing protein [Bryobacteraceae bacterium]|jgi:anti-sigma factor RsiW
MNCDETRLILPEYLNESLGEAQELAFSSHLATCEACRAEAERLGSLWRGLALLPGTFPEPGSNVRDRFYESLAAYRHGMESARHGWREKLAALWPRQPAWQMGISFALLVIGVGVGYEVRPAGSEVAQLRGEVSGMRQMVALSLMQQQSAGERLRGVSWAYRVESSDTEVLSALLATVNNDASVNVRLAAVDALHAFGASPVTRTAIIQSIPKQTAPLVQIALIELLVDLKVTESATELKKLSADETVDTSVRERAKWALGKLLQ